MRICLQILHKPVVVILLFFSTKIITAEISAPENYIRQPFDVKQYDAIVDLSAYPTNYMTGICKISVDWLESPANNKFYFHLRDLSVDSVFYQNIRVNAIEVGTKEDSTYHYEVTPPPELSSSSVTITVYYHGAMTTEYNNRPTKWGGVHAKGDVLFSLGVGFYNNYVSCTQHWLPCYDHPSDKAIFKAKFIVPIGKSVASNGLLKEIINPGNGTEIYIWEHNYDCATYNYTFAVSNYFPVYFGNGDLPMVVYSKPADTLAVRTTFKLLPKMVDAFEERFGKYPFEKVGYVLTPSSGGSMEHETMISYYESLARGKDTVNETAAHELSHMWFGDMVTPYDFRDAWLNESFASFCESIWNEDLLGFEQYLNHLDYMRNYYISNPNGSKFEGIFPLYNFSRKFPSSNYPLTIYFKGAVVVGMLRYELGDSVFFPALRQYLEARKYSNANTDTLISFCERLSGKELDWFFMQWIYGKGWIQLQTTFEKKEDGSERLILTQIQPDSFGVYTDVPVEIGFEKPSGEFEYMMFRLKGKENSYVFDLNFDCNRLVINKGPTIRTLLEDKGINIVSVEPSLSEGIIRIFPNPSEYQMIISFPSGDGKAELKIFNETGNVVQMDSIITKKGLNFYNIDTQDLPPGQYFVVFNFNGKLQKEKFVIIR